MSIAPGNTVSVTDFRGLIMAWAGTSEPTGWLFCRGQEVSRVTYAELYAIIGTTYGDGDGSTTFNLPDCQGRSILGAGQANRSYVESIATGNIDTALNAFLVPNARIYGNAKPVAIAAGAGQIFGVKTTEGDGAVDSSGWIGINGAAVPEIGTKVVISELGNASGVTGLKWVVELNAERTEFRVSNTEGGAAITTATTDASVYWVRVESDNTDGESATASITDSSNTAIDLGGNAMPEIGDKILITTEISTDLDRGSIYTVNGLNASSFTVGAASDNGSVRWINLGPEATQPQIARTYYGVYVDETHLGIAASLEDALNGDVLDINTQGTATITLTYTDTLTDHSEGDQGGHETNLISVSELPPHTHETLQSSGSSGSQKRIAQDSSASDDGYSLNDNLIGPTPTNEPQSVMQPYIILNYIIKF